MSDSDVVIRVEGLGKKYSLHHEQGERYTALRDVVARQAKAARRLLNPFTLAGQLRKAQREAAESSEEEFWALKDVSFEIRRGERVGIIGRNGAGKSTLLKILSRITEPTTGRVEIRGRVASLLEVGTGFHPELTGRENIYLNGAILGMTRREIRTKFDEIVDFAEVEKFLDTPVKRYSSGMYVRLAFAVAAHLEPEILVVDEVLAVGDASFQKKCLGKMEDVAEREGRTVLFVSHNLQAIGLLTQKCLLLDSGECLNYERTNQVLSIYNSLGRKSLDYIDSTQNPGPRIKKVLVKTSEGPGLHRLGAKLYFEITVSTEIPINTMALSFQIVDDVNQPVIHLLIQDPEAPLRGINGCLTLSCTIPSPRLYIGMYKLSVYLADKDSNSILQALNDICPFEIIFMGPPRDYYWHPGAAKYVEEAEWVINDSPISNKEP